MDRIHRVLAFGLLAAAAGCFVSYHREHLASQVPRADGTVLAVECVSSVKSQVSSISPSLGDEPRVTVIKDGLTFVVTSTAITLNGEPYAELDLGIEKVLITITEEGFRIEADGETLRPPKPNLGSESDHNLEVADPAPSGG